MIESFKECQDIRARADPAVVQPVMNRVILHPGDGLLLSEAVLERASS